MLSIKKVIGKDEKEVTLEDVYNKLCGLEMAYSTILYSEDFSLGGDFFPSASIGLSNLFTEALREMDAMINSEGSTETLTEKKDVLPLPLPSTKRRGKRK